jgi:hypothetical protein
MASPPRRLTHAELYDEIRELVREKNRNGETIHAAWVVPILEKHYPMPRTSAK